MVHFIRLLLYKHIQLRICFMSSDLFDVNKSNMISDSPL